MSESSRLHIVLTSSAPKNRFDLARASLTISDILDRLREQGEGERGSAKILKGARAE